MTALILLGGLGSRLRPLTLSRPKPLLPILNRPFITYQLNLLKKFGVRRIVLALGHQAAHFRRKLGTGKAWGVRFVYSFEREPLGTGGAIRHALPHLTGPAFILNGDVLSDFDLDAMARGHTKNKADATLALVEVEDPTPFGLVETDRRGFIRRFLEKPSGDSFPVRTVNAGCYLFDPQVVERIAPDRPVSVEREIFPALLSEGYRLGSFLHRGYWSDIGTLRTYWRTHQDLQKSPRDGAKVLRGAGTRVDKSARLGPNVIVGEKCWVGPGVVLDGGVTLGDRVRVEEGACVEDSVVLEGTRIGPRSHVERSIVGAKVTIAADCRVGPDHVLGDGTRLTSFSQTLPGLAKS